MSTPSTKPGIHYGMSFADYCAIDAINQSRLKLIIRSPAHYQHAAEQPREDPSPAMALGTAVHALVLEPEQAMERLAVIPSDINRRTNDGRARYAEFIEASKGKTVLTLDDLGTAYKIRDAVLAHGSAADCVRLITGQSEVVMVWTDPDTGLTCKARVDRFAGVDLKDRWGRPPIGPFDRDWITGVDHYVAAPIELKTTRDASREGFAREARRYSYPFQSAFYAMGAGACGIELEPLRIVAVENEPPHLVAVHTLGLPSLELGKAQVRTALYRLKACLEANEWPGYADDATPLDVPMYGGEETTSEFGF